MEQPIEQTRPPRSALDIINGWPFFFLFASGSAAFILLNIAYQFYFQDPEKISAIVRGTAFSGALLVSLSLLSSIVFKAIPRFAQYWRIRRFLGVSGLAAAVLHVTTIYTKYWMLDLSYLLSSPNPIQNPLLFGLIAFVVLLAMGMTSFEWMVRKLGRKWKYNHRFIYLGYPALIFHYLLMNPSALRSLPGALLIMLTFATVVGQLFWFFRMASVKDYKTMSTAVVAVLMSAFVIIAFLAF